MSNAQIAETTTPNAQPAEIVNAPVVSCDGGNGTMGHPRVFLTFNHASELKCPYCSKLFRLAPGAKMGHGH